MKERVYIKKNIYSKPLNNIFHKPYHTPFRPFLIFLYFILKKEKRKSNYLFLIFLLFFFLKNVYERINLHHFLFFPFILVQEFFFFNINDVICKIICLRLITSSIWLKDAWVYFRFFMVAFFMFKWISGKMCCLFLFCYVVRRIDEHIR